MSDMNPAEAFVICFQIVLPVILLVWLGIAPGKSTLMYLMQFATVALCLLALCLVPIWLVPPWWAPRVYVAAGVTIVGGQWLRGTIPRRPRLPWRRSQWAAFAVLGLTSAGLGVLISSAISGRPVPDPVVDVAFPLGSGSYLIANGGSTRTVNEHLLTLEPDTDRQRAYRGQSYAVDLIGLDDFGFRAAGWWPRDPSAYEIFGEPVFAPCSGDVLAAADGMPDMFVPEMDSSRLEGNHVFIDCGGFGVLLAHLRVGSLRVAVGDRVEVGARLGDVGNSGQSAEPHLHIHAQRIPADGALLAGEPLFLTLDRRFFVRNDRVAVDLQ